MHLLSLTRDRVPPPPTRATAPGKLAQLADEAAAGPGVFLMAATLRPETMYGQTNCWALPEGRYGAFRGLGGEVYVMTQRAALNLSYQVRWPCGADGRAPCSAALACCFGVLLGLELACLPFAV